MSNLRKVFIVALLSLFTVNLVYAKPVKWRIAESWPKGFPLFGDVVRGMAAKVDLLSAGEFKIQIVSKGEHKRSLEVFDMVEAGEFEMGHSVSQWWIKKDPNTAFFTSVPMGMIMPEKYGWFYHGGGLELMQKVYSKYGLLSFPGGNTGTEMGGWFKKEIKSLDDLKGLKIRMPGWAGEVYTAAGSVVTLIPPGDLYPALEDGTLDALEFIGPALDYGMKFHEVAKYYYTGWHSPGTELQFLVNDAEFKKLSKQNQNILLTAMKLSAYEMYPQTYHQSAINLEKILDEHPDVKIRAFPRAVFREFGDIMAKNLEERARTGNDLTKEIIASRQAYFDKARRWTRISDQAFLNNSFQ
jgi:TRAP-type mannitol/chloroaromatic compound transport system substrate-binding protein